MANKQYGLIFPKKAQLSAPKAGNIFGNDDDSDEEEGTDWVKKALKAEHEKNKVKKQTQLNMQRALKEDPTIFQYDEVYDEMERTKEEEKSVKKVEKKAKYIDNLLKSAELRKKEQELRKDRMIQKEIEAEDAMFPDKERYVTSSYKAKLEEMKKFEEQQANQDRLEAIGDVTKQNDMSGFYRHLYRQTVEKNEADLGAASEIKELNKGDNVENQSDIDKDDPIPTDSESESEGSTKSEDENKKEIPKMSSIVKAKKERQYRKRAQEDSESESEHETEPESGKDLQKTVEKIEKVVEESVSDTSTLPKKQKLSDEKEVEKSLEINESPIDDNIKESTETSEKINGDAEKDEVSEVTEKKVWSEPKKKENIWKKRTVGDVFEAALERYLIRKQQRLAGS